MKLFMERWYVKFQFYISRKVEVVGFCIEIEYIMVEQLLVGNKNIGNVKVTGFYSVWREKNTKQGVFKR